MIGINIPKLCKSYEAANGIYQLILYNNYNKDLKVLRVQDKTACNPLRYTFLIDEELVSGHYNYYLIKDDEWIYDQINYDRILKTYKILDKNDNIFDKGVPVFNDAFLALGDTLIVVDHSKITKQIDTCGHQYEFENVPSTLLDSEGEWFKYEIQILAKGLVFVESDIKQEEIYYKNKDNIKVYEG